MRRRSSANRPSRTASDGESPASLAASVLCAGRAHLLRLGASVPCENMEPRRQGADHGPGVRRGYVADVERSHGPRELAVMSPGYGRGLADSDGSDIDPNEMPGEYESTTQSVEGQLPGALELKALSIHEDNLPAEFTVTDQNIRAAAAAAAAAAAYPIRSKSPIEEQQVWLSKLEDLVLHIDEAAVAAKKALQRDDCTDSVPSSSSSGTALFTSDAGDEIEEQSDLGQRHRGGWRKLLGRSSPLRTRPPLRQAAAGAEQSTDEVAASLSQPGDTELLAGSLMVRSRRPGAAPSVRTLSAKTRLCSLWRVCSSYPPLAPRRVPDVAHCRPKPRLQLPAEPGCPQRRKSASQQARRYPSPPPPAPSAGRRC